MPAGRRGKRRGRLRAPCPPTRSRPTTRRSRPRTSGAPDASTPTASRCSCASAARSPPRCSSSEILGLKTLLFSFSTADENLHAPNEFFRLRPAREGMRAWDTLSQLLAPRSRRHSLFRAANVVRWSAATSGGESSGGRSGPMNGRWLRVRWLVLLGVVAALALSACGGEEEAAPPAEPAPAEPAPAEPPAEPRRATGRAGQPAEPAAPRGRPKRGGDLTIARIDDSTSFDKTNVFQNESIWMYRADHGVALRRHARRQGRASRGSRRASSSRRTG